MAAVADPAVTRELNALEASLAAFVRNELSQVAYEFTRSVRASTELTAAVFSVSSIRGMWRPRVPGIMRRVLGVAQQSVNRLARQVGVRQLPSGWSDLSSPTRLPDELDAWAADVNRRLYQVGDTMAEEAMRELAQGLNEGETQAQLEARLIAAFNRNSHLMGPDRADRIAATETVSAWNSAALGFARAVSATGIAGLSKRWVTRSDDKVRAAHRGVAGQLKALHEAFDVAGTRMQYPGDPTAPPDLTINCRCVLQIDQAAVAAVAAVRDTVADRTGRDHASMDEDSAAQVARVFQSGMPAQLKEYWLAGPGAAKIRWGTPGAFKRCVRALHGKFPQDTEGLCANLYHEATGRWPGQGHGAEDVTEFEDEYLDTEETADQMDMNEPDPTPVPWGNDGTSVLAFENQTTGDGRAFEPGAITWDAAPKPLMYCEEMGEGHEGAKLAGAIFNVARNGDAILGSGVLYPSIDAGEEALDLLALDAPLGVSVDLDDVSMVMVDQSQGGDGGQYTGHLITASVMHLADGGYILTGETDPEWTASGLSLAGESSKVVFHVGPDGTVPAAAFTSTDVATASAGDPAMGGSVLEQHQSSDYLMRITGARLRGATLVPVPAFAGARIVLDNPVTGYALAAAAADSGDGYAEVVAEVNSSDLPATASDVAHKLSMSVGTVKRHLSAAAQKGYIVRIARGTYIRSDQTPDENPFRTVLDRRSGTGQEARTASGEGFDGDVLTAASTGAVDLPVAPRDHAWDGPGAEARMFDHANGDWAEYGRGFAWTDDTADPQTKGAYHLPYADIIDGRLTIVPRGVFAAQAALNGGRGGVDIPADQKSAVSDKLERLRVHVEESTGGDARQQMEASAWSAIRDLPPMPADWFREPTPDELPTDMGGVHYAGGRIFGWVARAGEPHAGFAKKITIESLGRIDTTHFLRQRFTLDDGSTVRAGALTMNTGHHRDGAECETSACAFDDTRTVAGIVTVGMNERGMWFSGAAHPTLSEWDRRVFMACEPSYHLKKGSNGAWQLRGVLTVPVPGHSTPMVASISGVVERNNLALTAAAQEAEIEEAIAAARQLTADTLPALVHETPAPAPVIDYDRLADAMVAAMVRAEARKLDEAAELEALLAEAAEISASGYDGNATDEPQEG
jgi:hypothetical protein